jgi:hypothetical protein
MLGGLVVMVGGAFLSWLITGLALGPAVMVGAGMVGVGSMLAFPADRAWERTLRAH